MKHNISPPLKWHGGKHTLASRIVSLMPSHLHYVEPFAGGLAVLLAKEPEGVSEVVNDLDGSLTTFFRVLQSDDLFARFVRIVEAVPFSETEWRDAGDRLDDPDPVTRAVAFFIRCRQSMAGRRKDHAPTTRTRTRRGMNEQCSAWLTAIEGLPAVHRRLMRVRILCRDALDVIRQEDGPDTLFYLDPPYLHETRASTGEYRHEMIEEQHRELLDLIQAVRGKVMLSGYPSTLYDTLLADWTRHTFDVPNHAAGGTTKRRMQEVLWCNW